MWVSFLSTSEIRRSFRKEKKDVGTNFGSLSDHQCFVESRGRLLIDEGLTLGPAGMIESSAVQDSG